MAPQSCNISHEVKVIKYLLFKKYIYYLFLRHLYIFNVKCVKTSCCVKLVLFLAGGKYERHES